MSEEQQQKMKEAADIRPSPPSAMSEEQQQKMEKAANIRPSASSPMMVIVFIF